MQEQFHRPQGEGLTEELTQQLRAIEDKLQALRGEFEQLVVGVDLEAFAPKEEVSFNWTKEVQVLLSPLLNGLKRLTARPRAMDRLRDEIASAQEQRRLTATALDHIDQLAGQLPDPALSFAELRCTLRARESNSLPPRAVAPGAFFFSRRAGTVLFPPREQPLDQLLRLPPHRDAHLAMRSCS